MYITLNPDFENNDKIVFLWKELLSTVSKYKSLLQDNIIVKGGSYYPRLCDTKKRGIRAFKELQSLECWSGFGRDILANWLIKEKDLNNISGINFIKTDFNILDFHLLTDNLDLIDFCKKEHFVFSETPPNYIPVEEVAVVPFDEKVKVITDYFESLEFTRKEIAKTISILANYLEENL